jgi:hypothetical protein
VAVKNKTKSKREVVAEVSAETVVETKKLGKKMGFFEGTGWTLLLIGGLAHMLPEQMAPVLKWALWGVSLQTAVGALSVVLALYFLLED